MAGYNLIYNRYIEKSDKAIPAEKMQRGNFYMIKQYEYVDGTKQTYSGIDSPIIYTLFVSRSKNIVHAVKVTNIRPDLIKKFFGKFVNEDEQTLEIKGGARRFYSSVVSKVPIITSDAYRTYKMSGFGRVMELDMNVEKLIPPSKIPVKENLTKSVKEQNNENIQ